MTDYRPGDKVRVTFESVIPRSGVLSIVDGGFKVDNKTVEVIERADYPANDPVGTVRTTPLGPAIKTAAREYSWKLIHQPYQEDDLNGYLSTSTDLGEIIGTVPGFAESEQPKPKLRAFKDKRTGAVYEVVPGRWLYASSREDAERMHESDPELAWESKGDDRSVYRTPIDE